MYHTDFFFFLMYCSFVWWQSECCEYTCRFWTKQCIIYKAHIFQQNVCARKFKNKSFIFFNIYTLQCWFILEEMSPFYFLFFLSVPVFPLCFLMMFSCVSAEVVVPQSSFVCLLSCLCSTTVDPLICLVCCYCGCCYLYPNFFLSFLIPRQF